MRAPKLYSGQSRQILTSDPQDKESGSIILQTGATSTASTTTIASTTTATTATSTTTATTTITSTTTATTTITTSITVLHNLNNYSFHLALL